MRRESWLCNQLVSAGGHCSGWSPLGNPVTNWSVAAAGAFDDEGRLVVGLAGNNAVPPFVEVLSVEM